MIITLVKNPDKERYDSLFSRLNTLNLQIHVIEGIDKTVIGLLGDTSEIDEELINAFDIVDSVKRITPPYKIAERAHHPVDTVIEVGGKKFGDGNFEIIAGPCSVESREQITGIARMVKASGAGILRGGAFKPRTSPYSFQGMRAYGIELLTMAKESTGMPIVTEIMDISQLDLFENIDMIQVGARNMQNYELLKELGKVDKPILLKRGLANTLNEFLLSAEYLLASGNDRVILCERGIRTFETAARNTLDLSAVPLLKEKTHLPVIVDPSHATGNRKLVPPMALAATACGADGIMVEVHNDPEHALCDGAQSLDPIEFDELAKAVMAIRPYSYKPNIERNR